MPPSRTLASSTRSAVAKPEPSSRISKQKTRRNVTVLQEDSAEVDVNDVNALDGPQATASTTDVRTGLDIRRTIAILPGVLTRDLTGLQKRDLTVLRKKAQWLQKHDIGLPRTQDPMSLAPIINATLVFAQEDAGTAVCIHPEGILLTCSHCVAESAEELEGNLLKWLIFRSGQVVEAACVAWDPKRDLALLRIVACQDSPRARFQAASSSSSIAVPTRSFPFVTLATSPPAVRTPLVCIGHPGSEDLETHKPGVKTNYDVLHVSTGVFRGYAAGQDVQNNSDIGALMHDCWTYWGHSGAPLIEQESRALIGLHSSWDDQTGMRRGIGLEAINAFLDEHAELWRPSSKKELVS